MGNVRSPPDVSKESLTQGHLNPCIYIGNSGSVLMCLDVMQEGLAVEYRACRTTLHRKRAQVRRSPSENLALLPVSSGECDC